MIDAEADPDHFLYENVDALDGPNLPYTSRPGMPIRGSPSMDQSAVELVEELQKAIHSGNERLAMEVAKLLASMRLSVTASLDRNLEFRAVEHEISIRIHICSKDSTSTENHIIMKLRPTMTFETLKLVVYQKHGYLPELQKWIVGRRLAHDRETLAECGINFSGAVMFLYLVTPKGSKHSQGFQIRDPMSGSTSLEDVTMIQSALRHEQPVASAPLFSSVALKIAPASTPPISIRTQAGGISTQTQTVRAVPVLLSSSPKKVGWACPRCTYVNLPTRPGCEMCAEDRPDTYTVPLDCTPIDHKIQLLNRGTEFLVLAEEDYDDVDVITEDYDDVDVITEDHSS